MEILSSREREVLTAAARGMSVVETGRALYLSPDTVKTYRRHINRHLGARNMTQAVALAITSISWCLSIPCGSPDNPQLPHHHQRRDIRAAIFVNDCVIK